MGPNDLFQATECNGNNQDQFPANNMFAAVSVGLWDNGAACGRRYMMRCLSGTDRKTCKVDGSIIVEVVDRCSDPCPANFLLSTPAFAALSRVQDARINVEFTQYVSS
ncbi:EG45-like domain containing protein [Canna indica]|uniref:EG45-like domain containing protein n=1 Tax=Canna indica TaxID=4628 RepID=A0AAQ3KRT7_9LILI|nr:EG45-like domain containing protein [Canna indica]